MDLERLPGFLLSLCLHLGLFTLVLFWPASAPRPVDLNAGPTITGIVTIGREGKANPNARRSIPDAGRQEQVAPPVEPARPEPVRPEPVRPEPPKPDPVTPAPPLPEVKPPLPEVKPVENVPDATPILKEPEKPKTQNATAQAKPQTPPSNVPENSPPAKNATAQIQPAKNATQPATPAKPRESLDSVLAGLKRETGRRGPAGAAGNRGESLSSALDDLAKEVGGSGTDDSGTGPGGRGGDGVGILGAYEDSIVSRVKPNWSWPGRTDRRNYVAVVNVRIARDGAITEARITRSSGNSYFDATVLRAVTATKQLEPPPKPEYRDMDIMFNSDELGK